MTKKMFSGLGRTAALVLALLGSGGAAQAATYTVANNSNSGAGSLRQAILDANANAGADIINFPQSWMGTVTTITLDAPLMVSDDLTINGNGLITLDGNNATGILVSTNNATTMRTLVLRGLKFVNGIRSFGAGTAYDFTATTIFGGVSSREHLVLENVDFDNCVGSVFHGGLTTQQAKPDLTVANCRFTNGQPNPSAVFRPVLQVSYATATYSLAGAVNIGNCVFDGNKGNVLIGGGTAISVKNCSFTGNLAGYGGGLYINPQTSSEVTSILVENCTIAFNQANTNSSGGGLAIFNLYPTAVASVNNCTIYKNTGDDLAYGTELVFTRGTNGGGTVNINNSIIYGGTGRDFGSGGQIGPDAVKFTNCVIGVNSTTIVAEQAKYTFTGCTAAGTDPLLAATAGYNGGFVKTLAFAGTTSPAINLGLSSLSINADSRGFARDFAGSRVDAGAYERAGGTFSFLGTTNPPRNMLNSHTNGLFTLTYGSPVAKGTGNIYVYEAPSTLIATIPVGNAEVAISGNKVSVAAGVLPQNKRIYITMDAGVFTYTADGITSTSAAVTGDQTITFTTGNLVVLPVTLASFTAKVDGNRGRLSWEVKSEAGNREFIIYRSGGDRNFVKIGAVAAGSDYVFYDERPLNGMNYYQLSQVDNDGVEKALDIRELRFGLGRELVSAYPNPTKGLVNLKCTDAGLWGSTAVLSDVQGKKLQQLVVRAHQELDLGGLPSGVYLLKYVNGTVLRIVRQ